MYDFSTRLKQLRKEKQISLDELAVAVESTKSTLSKYERGIVDPTLQVAKKIADYFGVSLDWIAGVSDDKAQRIPGEYINLIDKCIKANVSATKIEQFIDIIK